MCQPTLPWFVTNWETLCPKLLFIVKFERQSGLCWTISTLKLASVRWSFCSHCRVGPWKQPMWFSSFHVADITSSSAGKATVDHVRWGPCFDGTQSSAVKEARALQTSQGRDWFCGLEVDEMQQTHFNWDAYWKCASNVILPFIRCKPTNTSYYSSSWLKRRQLVTLPSKISITIVSNQDYICWSSNQCTASFPELSWKWSRACHK